MQSMQAIHSFDDHAGRIFSLAVCCMADGRRWAASASHDRTVRIWCVNTLQHIRTIEYSDFVWRVFIVKIPQPVVVAFISAEGTIQISDLQTGELLNTYSGRLIFSGTVSLFPHPIIITAEGEEDVSFVDITTGNKLKTICGGFDKMFRAVVTHGPSPLLVFTTWNTQTRRSTIQTYDLLEDEVNTPRSALSDDGEGDEPVAPSQPGSPGRLKSCRSSFSSVSVSCKTKMTLMFEGDSRDGVTSLVITQGGAQPRICSGHYDFMVRLWSIESKELLMVLEGHTDYVGAVACWKGNLPIVVSGSSDGTIKAWNTQTGALIATGEGHTRDAWALGVTNEPHARILSGSFDRTVKVWDLNPVLREINWQRRRDYCLFLAMLGFCGRRSGVNPAALPQSDEQLDQEQLVTQRVFGSPPLYRTIASFL